MTSESVWSQLTRLIGDEDIPPEQATETVMKDLSARWKDFSRPFVLRAARGIEGRIVNRRMRRAIGPAALGSRHHESAMGRLSTTVYHLPDGQRVLWDDMTVVMLDLKIAQLRKHIGSLVDHLRVLEVARKLCADRGVDRLGDIAGWAELVAAETASAEVVAGPSVTAREPVTSTDPAGVPRRTSKRVKVA